jgi:hypothetical protein
MRWREKLDDWHSMFCWQPYCIDGTWVWLERIHRRRTLAHMWGDNFEYRIPAKADQSPKGEDAKRLSSRERRSRRDLPE